MKLVYRGLAYQIKAIALTPEETEKMNKFREISDSIPQTVQFLKYRGRFYQASSPLATQI